MHFTNTAVSYDIMSTVGTKENDNEIQNFSIQTALASELEYVYYAQ